MLATKTHEKQSPSIVLQRPTSLLVTKYATSIYILQPTTYSSFRTTKVTPTTPCLSQPMPHPPQHNQQKTQPLLPHHHSPRFTSKKTYLPTYLPHAPPHLLSFTLHPSLFQKKPVYIATPTQNPSLLPPQPSQTNPQPPHSSKAAAI